MFTKKLDSTDREEIRKRQEMIHQHQLIAQALEVQKQQYITSLFPKYRLDPRRQYDIDLKTGRITEAKRQLP